jgi:16S rRNA processing protein RimM
MELVKLAEITKTLGLKGQVRCYSLTDFPEDRFKRGHKLILQETDGTTSTVTVDYFRDEGRFRSLGFKEWTTIEEAEKHPHASLMIEKKTPLSPTAITAWRI